MEIAGDLVVRMGRGAASSLLIGIGNPLRGDDGVGPWLVETWGQRRAWRAASHAAAFGAAEGQAGDQLTGLRVLVVDQLLPELAEELAAVRRVLFVDAWRVASNQGARAGRPLQTGSQDAEASRNAPLGSGHRDSDPQRSEPQRSEPRLLPIATADRRAADAAGWGVPAWTPGHHLTAAVLLQLTAGLYGRVPAAHSLLIPATAFAATDPGGGPSRFSASLRIQLPRAWQLLDHWLQQTCVFGVSASGEFERRDCDDTILLFNGSPAAKSPG